MLSVSCHQPKLKTALLLSGFYVVTVTGTDSDPFASIIVLVDISKKFVFFLHYPFALRSNHVLGVH